MGTRSYADVAPTAATIALNAYIFGYGGHSLVTPHVALKQLWWTDERIERKVTRSFVVSKLRGEERQFLDRPLAFGEGLTDDTYMEWILERAKRLFLILAEIGVPDQIFGCIDDSWDDDDLPLPLENVKNLELSYEDNDLLNRRFYHMQFVFLLRELKPGAHLDYGPKEHIPMEYVNTLPPAVSLQIWDRIHFPGRPDEIYTRRKFSFVDKEAYDYRSSFMDDLKTARTLQHEHIANIWASYTSDDAGYTLSTFVPEHTLGTFIDHRTPMQLMRVPASERPALLLEWLHCLADALASIHHYGFAHCAIRPSNILIDHDNHVAFADVGSLPTFQRGKKPFKTETYDYAAPESQHCTLPAVLASSPPVSSLSAFSKLRKKSSASSSGSSSTSSSTRSNSICTTVPTSPTTTRSSFNRADSLLIEMTSTPPMPQPRTSSHSFRNFSRHLHSRSTPSASLPSSPTSCITPVTILPRSNFFGPDVLQDLPEASPEMSDIFSLGCIFLDILTFLLRGKITEFTKFRATRVQMTGSRNRIRMDRSFHCDPDKVEIWMQLLQEDSQRQASGGHHVYRGISELLNLIRQMLLQNPALRPTAQEVRDRVQDILVDQCGIETLCCASRLWDVPPLPEALIGGPVRDSFSIAPASLAPGSRRGSGCPRSACIDRIEMSSKLASEISLPSPQPARPASAASTVTAKLGSWRRMFSRSRQSSVCRQ